MNRSFSKIISGALIAILLLLPSMWLGELQATSVSEVQSQLAKKNDEIAALEAEIAQYQKDIEDLGNQKDSLSATIQSYDLTIKKLDADISLTEKKIDAANLEITRLNDQISIADGKLLKNKDALEKSLREAQFGDGTSFIESWLSGKTLANFWDYMYELEQFQSAVQAATVDLNNTKTDLSGLKDEQLATKKELSDLKSELSDRRQIAASSRADKNTLLKQTQNKESEYKKLLAEKQAQYEASQQEIFDLENQLSYLLDPSKLPSATHGVLSWPLNSIYVTQQFGVTADSGRLYRSGSHNGTDFGATVGTKLYSVADGVVQAIGNTDVGKCYSYGKWVLIKHNNGLSSLYGHLSAISVSVGQQVSRRQFIGYSGNTGYTTGPHLHLTIFATDGVTVENLGTWYKKNGLPAATACAAAGVTIPVANPSAYLDPMVYLPAL